MSENKRKRGRKPKIRVPETLNIQTITNTKATTSSPSIDDVVDLNHQHHLRRSGRASKIVDKRNKPLVGPKKALVVPSTRVVPFMNAVVKVFCTHTEPNFEYSSSSSGFVIGGRRVLTDARSVEHYTRVKLKKRGVDKIYVAKVLAIGSECNIALLTVDNDEFWEDTSPVEFGDLPALQDAVTVVGYPISGDTISVTSGVVLRIEILSYVHGSTELLRLQINAAINPGNSGGPVFNDKGNCVGISFRSLKHQDAENIGYVIPSPVIMHFIRDYEKNGAYTGNDNELQHVDGDEDDGELECSGDDEEIGDHEVLDVVCESREQGADRDDPRPLSCELPVVVVDASRTAHGTISSDVEFFWHGHRVSKKCMDLLSAVEQRYPETFCGLKIRREKLWETYLEIFEQVMSKFLGIVLSDLTVGIVADLRADLDELTEYGFDVSWASERLNAASELCERERVHREVRELEVAMTTITRQVEALKGELSIAQAEMGKMTQLLETKRAFIARLHNPSFVRLSLGCLGSDLV